MKFKVSIGHSPRTGRADWSTRVNGHTLSNNTVVEEVLKVTVEDSGETIMVTKGKTAPKMVGVKEMVPMTKELAKELVAAGKAKGLNISIEPHKDRRSRKEAKAETETNDEEPTGGEGEGKALDDMDKKELKALCEERGLETKGSKADLIARLTK